MEKYWLVIKNTWGEYFIYRLNFVMWRVRTILQLLVVYFLWSAIFQSQKGVIFGYTQSMILTYVLGGALLRATVFSSRTIDVGDEINRGNLTNFLLKPMSYFKYWFARDIADKILNIIFAVFELTVIYFLLKPPIFSQTDFLNLAFFAIGVGLAVILYFYINLLFGLLAFWTPETWAPRFVFFIFLEFLAGGLFPLDILPKFLYEILRFLPLFYLNFFPLKIYLGQLSILQIIEGMIICLSWIILSFWIVRVVWQRGLRVYSAEGR
ncbi:MAG: ABC-2 family transporter protein [bacterium]|nr:ABC-2 family transporter protein [bacterium]